ncbi:helix-turn-helix domain-containing protein [Marinicrinis sediminis]|uniref:Helix-turn-helix domain-containing protein n=1 Tax=Marinicrinis sediminis TaxID=1652465 RepID=A0ABW5RB68_9BACL
MKEINDRIKQLRLNEGLSMKAFAEIIGVSAGNVGDWESDKRVSTPSSVALQSIARNFEVSLDWLINGQESISVEGLTQDQIAKIKHYIDNLKKDPH